MIESNAGSNIPPRINSLQKFALALQVFLLRRGWMGPAGDFLMAITTTGRKTGRTFTIPVSYMRDGDDIIAPNPGNSNWFHNVLANGQAIIEVKRQQMPVTGTLVKDEAERQHIFSLYRNGDQQVFERIFKLPPSAPEETLQAELRKWQFVRFKRK
jgi:deazaflavin-dependent oxidoreductase (nitroreductase family)